LKAAIAHADKIGLEREAAHGRKKLASMES